jgi:2-oxoisovalerate dehydrogenase E2 component (dihydrolipoyl transacylase)
MVEPSRYAGTEPAAMPRVTPLGRRLAQAHGLDLAGVAGSGQGGRITRDDVQRRLGDAMDRSPPVGTALPDAPLPETVPDRPLPVLTPGAAPTAWMLMEADLTPLLRAIARQAAAFRAGEGVDLTPLAAVLRAVTIALAEQPLLNATWAGTGIRLRPSITLAVAGLDGVPRVIPQAESLSLPALARALADPAPASDAPTFTVFTGDVAARLAQPVLPDGQAACLVTGPPARRLTVVDDTLAPRVIASLAVVFDHRVLDGAPAGRFLRTVRAWLEAGEVG